MHGGINSFQSEPTLPGQDVFNRKCRTLIFAPKREKPFLVVLRVSVCLRFTLFPKHVIAVNDQLSSTYGVTGATFSPVFKSNTSDLSWSYGKRFENPAGYVIPRIPGKL